MPRPLGALVVAIALSLVGCGSDILGVEAPKQTERVNPMSERGKESFDQRQKDCWEMATAAACYEVGMNYEMGLAVETDLKKAVEYYDKACALEQQKETLRRGKTHTRKTAVACYEAGGCLRRTMVAPQPPRWAGASP